MKDRLKPLNLQPTECDRYLSRDCTSAIKGVAIILMIVHHFFTFPSYYIEGISYPYLEGVAEYLCWPTKICVGIFAFLTGWGYAFCKKSNYAYSVKKILKTYLFYWVIYLPILAISVLTKCYIPTIKELLLEFAALYRPIMFFGWYIVFYAAAMLLMPLFSRLCSKNFLIGLFGGILLPIVVFYGLMQVFSRVGAEIPAELCNYLVSYFPCVIVGFLAARYRIFTDIIHPMLKKLHLDKWGVYLALMLIPCGCRYFLPSVFAVNLDILYAPIFVFGAASLKLNSSILSFLGRQSLNIWLLHCAFFGVTKQVMQPIAFFLKFPPLVIIWVLAMLSGVSVCINLLMRPITKRI